MQRLVDRLVVLSYGPSKYSVLVATEKRRACILLLARATRKPHVSTSLCTSYVGL